MSSADTEVVSKPLPETVEPHVQPDSHDEEYESADDAYEDEEVEEIEVEEEVEEEEEYEKEGERSASQQEKELDDDEDVKNPQFIPKRGYFYEHDDRTKQEEEVEGGEGGEEEVAKKVVEEKKKPTAKEPDRWSHDLYNEDEQTPKSKDELNKAYGYEIWNDDQAPRARRRRRYGRGPNNYTRHWEDEEAYQKPRGGGFRGGRGGRGRGGGGNFRDNNRRRDGEGDNNSFEEEFPALPGSKPQSQSQPSQRGGKDFSERTRNPPPPRKDSGDRDREYQQRPHQQQSNRDGGGGGQQERRGRNDYDNERNGPRGGRGGGGFQGRGGRGRRNEFSNRNRYPNNRQEDEQQQQSYNNQTPTGNKGAPSSDVRDRLGPKVSPRGGGGGSGPAYNQDRRDNRNISSNTTPATNGHMRGDREQQRSKESPLSTKPPFTNTEYTGSHSLTANRGNTNKDRQQQQEAPQHHHVENNEPARIIERGSHQVPNQQRPPSSDKPQPPIQDAREIINARRMQQQQQQIQHQQNDHQQHQDRRPQQQQQQIPPRLQQQQQQPMPQQHPQYHPQQIEVSTKPKRYSVQRQQRQPESNNMNQGGGIPNSVGIPTTVPMSHGGVPPNMMPVVTGAEQLVPSPVPAYPQAPTYYEGPQVYEASGSPVTVATVAPNNGTSVSPSLWAPHAYTNAPYPSPPTGPQVPQAAYTADHAAYLAAQQAGPIYSAPPQFIQDPAAMMNYQGAAPPFAPAYHPQGYQGYPQVAPGHAPPPELYHAGVTYYNPQPQIQRQPMMAPKRTKTVLQLVEPPEKSSNKHDRQHMRNEMNQGHHDHPNQSQSPPAYNSGQSDNENQQIQHESDLVQQFESVHLEEPQQPEEQQRKSPHPPQESWSAQMEEMNSPTEIPEISFKQAIDEEIKSASPNPPVEVITNPPSEVAKVNEPSLSAAEGGSSSKVSPAQSPQPDLPLTKEDEPSQEK